MTPLESTLFFAALVLGFGSGLALLAIAAGVDEAILDRLTAIFRSTRS